MLITYKVFFMYLVLYIKFILYIYINNSNSATIKNNTNEKLYNYTRATIYRQQRI